MLVNNFKSILENYRQHTAGQQCPPGVPPPSFGLMAPKGTDNFCFVTVGSNGKVNKYSNDLRRVLTDLSEEFGSVGFVTEYFKEILQAEENNEEFHLKFPYPEVFYLALKRLTFVGGTESNPLEAVDFVRELRVNSAFLLGYHLALDETKESKPGA